MTALLVAIAVLLPIVPAWGAEDEPEVVCRATLLGNALVTRFEQPDGYRVDGVWTVLSLRPREFERRDAMLADLLLDHLTEYDGRNGRRAAVPLALRLRMETADGNPADALSRAIGAWCGTLARAAAEGLHVGGPGSVAPWWRI